VIESDRIFVPAPILSSPRESRARNVISCVRTPSDSFAQAAKFEDVLRHVQANQAREMRTMGAAARGGSTATPTRCVSTPAKTVAQP